MTRWRSDNVVVFTSKRELKGTLLRLSEYLAGAVITLIPVPVAPALVADDVQQ
jgi:hypothetical protein